MRGIPDPEKKKKDLCLPNEINWTYNQIYSRFICSLLQSQQLDTETTLFLWDTIKHVPNDNALQAKNLRLVKYASALNWIPC